MPTQAEMITQIEAALRQRYFAHIAKIEHERRATWTEQQHDVDRLSRSLAAYTLVNLADIDDAIAATVVTDGEDDFGIDAFYFDRSVPSLRLVQSKFKRTGAGPAQHENLKTINGVRALLQRRFSEFNAYFQRRIDEIEEALDTPGVRLEIALVFLGDNLSPHVSNDLDALKNEYPAIAWDWYGATRIFDWLIGEQTPPTITVDVTLENWAMVETPRKAVFGQLSVQQLAQLVELHGKALFEKNIRHYLGSVWVNRAIADTVGQRPGELFYLNNGLTAVAETITPAAGIPRRSVFRLTNMSIVNGAQTAGTIYNAVALNPPAPQAYVLITIIEVGAAQDDIARSITKARNYQTAVRGADFAGLDPVQERLRQELAVSGISYFYRPSAEARIRRDDAFTMEEAALALACLSLPILETDEVRRREIGGQRIYNAVNFVVDAKKEISRLWDQTGAAYGALFNDNLSGVKMCRLVRIYRFIDAVLADTESSEVTYVRRMFFRHGRYFIMMFAAQRAQAVISKPETKLSEEDKQALSPNINEMAELIYTESASFHGYRGYLSIFRNLTDSQPLADRVIRRLAAPAQPATAAAPPAPAPAV